MTRHLDIEALLERDLRSLAASPGTAAHLERCPECAERLALLRAAEQALTNALDSVATAQSAINVTGQVLQRAQARAFWAWTTFAALLVILAFVVSPWGAGSQAALGRWSEATPPRVVESYALHCMAPARAAELVLSRLEAEGSDVRPVSEATPVLVVSASAQEHVIVTRLLARFDQEGSVLCPR